MHQAVKRAEEPRPQESAAAGVPRSEDALHESERKLRLSLQASGLGTFYWYPQEDRVEADERMLGFFGLKENPELSLQKALATMIHPDDRARYAGSVARALDPRNDGKLREEIRVTWPDGSEHFLSVRGQVEFAGEPLRAVRMAGVIGDIAERKQVEGELRDNEERFRKLAEEREVVVRERTKEVEERKEDLMDKTKRLQEMSRRLIRLQDEERRYIAQELHDSAGQTLTVLAMNLAELEQLACGTSGGAHASVSAKGAAGATETGKKADAALAKKITETREIVARLTREIRTTSYLLHPPLLDDAGLGPTLRWYVEGLTERSNLAIELTVPKDLGRLAREMELAVFRVVQECLTNVLKHSGSGSVQIQIGRDYGNVLVIVKDRGKGIPAEKLASIQAGTSGMGIRGMRDRAGQLRGELSVDSDETGTRVMVRFPEAEERG